jgi:biopolymer transport protein ExbD
MNLGFQLRHARPRFKLSALRRKNELLCRIDMWGFVSVMLAFLAMFMAPAISFPDLPRYVPVDLAVAYHSRAMPGAMRDDAVTIAIMRDGSIYLCNLRVAAEDLSDQIRELVQNRAEKRIYLKADARAKYGNVTAILDQIRKAGVENLSLLTEQPYR